MQNTDNRTTNLNALILEDEPDIRDLITSIVEDAGFRVHTASGSESISRTVSSVRPDIVIMDLAMPELDGVSAIRLLGEIRCKAKIFIVSGADRHVLRAAQKYGTGQNLDIAGVITKPFDVNHLAEQLATCVPAHLMLGERDIRKAFAEKQFEVYLQPKMSLTNSGKLISDAAEALVRWNHPTHGLLLPGDFLPIMEANDLCDLLTREVLEQVGGFCQRLEQERRYPRIAINMPPELLSDRAWPDRIVDILKVYNTSPRQLSVEVTESSAMQSDDNAAEILMRLRLLGTHVSLDDYGTGYSSLVRLYQLPFNEIKIDRSLVMDVLETKEAAAIVDATVGLAHSLDLKVCAEGVEDGDVLDHLIRCGCDRFQGYHLGRPMTFDSFLSFIETRGELQASNVHRIR